MAPRTPCSHRATRPSISLHSDLALRTVSVSSFAYLGELRFSHPGDARCDRLLVQDDGLRKRGAQRKKIDGNVTLLWQGRRPADRHEFYRLYQRNAP